MGDELNKSIGRALANLWLMFAEADQMGDKMPELEIRAEPRQSYQDMMRQVRKNIAAPGVPVYPDWVAVDPDDGSLGELADGIIQKVSEEDQAFESKKQEVYAALEKAEQQNPIAQLGLGWPFCELAAFLAYNYDRKTAQ